MPVAADRLFAPEPAAPSRHPIFAVLAVVASVVVHGVALAAVIGWWGTEEAAPPQPFEVVMVTLSRPSQAPAPAATQGSGAPEPAERGGPPAVAMPVADAATPAERAPQPVSAHVTAFAAPATSIPASEPVRARVALTEPPAAVTADLAVEQAEVAHADTVQLEAEAPAVADPPRPITRPQPAAGSAIERPTRQVASHPAGPPATALAPASTAQGAIQTRAATGTSPAEFSLGSAGNPAPDYPFRARQRGWEGRVVLRVAVDRQGHPVRVDVAESSGHGVLDQAAHRTIAEWVFQPAKSGGRSVAGETLVPIVFRLN